MCIFVNTNCIFYIYCIFITEWFIVLLLNFLFYTCVIRHIKYLWNCLRLDALYSKLNVFGKILLSTHLPRKVMWSISIAWCPLSVNISHFIHLLKKLRMIFKPNMAEIFITRSCPSVVTCIWCQLMIWGRKRFWFVNMSKIFLITTRYFLTIVNFESIRQPRQLPLQSLFYKYWLYR